MPPLGRTLRRNVLSNRATPCRFGGNTPHRPGLRIGSGTIRCMSIHHPPDPRAKSGPQRCGSSHPPAPVISILFLPRSRPRIPRIRGFARHPATQLALRRETQSNVADTDHRPLLAALSRCFDLSLFWTVAIEADPNDRPPMPRTLHRSAARFSPRSGLAAPVTSTAASAPPSQRPAACVLIRSPQPRRLVSGRGSTFNDHFAEHTRVTEDRQQVTRS